ncbi:MAG: pilus assembly protein PilW, partial [Luteimonas sp.]
MIALTIGSLLILGLVEVFSASRIAYQMSEGLARVQENGRFAVDYLQRDLRMAGHMGCVNDQARFQTAPSGFGTLFATTANRAAENYAAVPFELRFDTAITGYEANGTAPGDTVNLAAPAGGWVGGLPALLTTLGPLGTGPLPGTDVVVLRYFSPEGAPMIGLT